MKILDFKIKIFEIKIFLWYKLLINKLETNFALKVFSCKPKPGFQGACPWVNEKTLQGRRAELVNME